MSSFLYRLGQRCARHPLRVLGIWILVAVAVLGLDRQLGGEVKDNFTVPGVEAQHADDVLNASFPELSGASGQIVFHVDTGTLAEPQNREAVDAALDHLRSADDVTTVSDPFDARGPTISGDGKTAFATVYYSIDPLEQQHTDQATEAADIARERGVQAELTGTLVAVEIEGNEAIGIAVAIVVLLVAFGSLIAMAVPIVTALIGLALGLGGVGIMAYFVDTPVTSTMIASMIGLGVGIDYALFVVTRHRQHLHEGMSIEDAAGVANATAGQSVLFAGMTVVIAITGLVMAGIPAITTMGFAAAIVVLFSMFIAVTLLPACLGLAGRNIDRWSIPHRKDRGREGRPTFAGRWAHHIGQRPTRYALASLAGLLLLAAPVLSLSMGFADDSNTGAATTQRHAYDLLTDNFGKGFNGPFTIVVDLSGSTDADALEHVAQAVSADPGIAAVQPPLVNASGDTAVVIAQPTTSPQDSATDDTVQRLRDDVLPTVTESTGTDVLVGGRTAMLSDLSERISARLPWFILAVVSLSFILLMIVFRSILVPLKAALMNLLSIGAAYGVIVAVFQWGWAKGLFGLESTVPVNPFVPMIMFAILFGLSMDYEVFLLSSVREEFQRSGDSHKSVVDGLAATARVITSAALIMISVFLAFVATEDVTVKMFGLGLATAVLIDATLVRMVLVPSTMSLLGSANWWLPRWLDRVLPHMDLEGGDFGHHEPAQAADDEDLIARTVHDGEREFAERASEGEGELVGASESSAGFVRSRVLLTVSILAAALGMTMAVATAGDDGEAGASSGPDPLLSEQWALAEIHLAEAQQLSTGCDVTIAIVDTGVDLDHPDLRDRIVAGIDLVEGDDVPDDENGHGTHVAGIAAASMDNGIGIAGAAPCAHIMPVRVLNAEGSGGDDTIAEGIRWAAEHGADVINLSLGESGILGRLRAGGELNDAIVDASELGAVVVAASGNDGTPRVRNYHLTVPVIVVGAIGPGGEPAEFSNFGDLRTLVAPGVAIMSTVPEHSTTIFPDGTDGYDELDGTSMATPYVAGVAALLVAQGRDAAEVERVLFETARDGEDDPRLGAGIVDAAAAVAQPLG